MSNEARANLENLPRLAGATVLQLAPDLDDGPQGRAILDIAVALQKAGARTLVAARPGALGRAFQALGIDCLTLRHDSVNPLRLRLNASRLERLIGRERIDIVHAHSAGGAWSALAATEKLPVWLVTSFPDSIPPRFSLRTFYRGALARGDHVLARSSYIAGPLIRRFGLQGDRISIVPQAIDRTLFDPATMNPQRVLALRESWSVPKGSRIILVPGPITPAGGQQVLIDAAAAMPRALLRDVTFVLLGEGRTQRGYARALRKRVSRHGLDAAFRQTGPCPDLPAAIAAADFVVLPTVEPRLDGRPLPEAQAMARPVVATAVGILPENLLAPPRMPKALRTGWLVPPGDARAMAETLGEALSLDLPAYRALAARARQFAEFMFSPQSVAGSVLKIYNELLDGPS